MRTLKQNSMRCLSAIVTITLAMAAGAQKPNNFIIEGTLKNLPVMPAKMYLVYDTISAKSPDSAVVKNGRYTFKGNIDEPVMASITPLLFDGRKASVEKGNIGNENIADVFLDKTTMNIASVKSIANAVVSGSVADKDYKEALKGYNRLMDTLKDIANVVRATGDMLIKNAVMGSIPKISRVINEDYYSFMKKNPKSVVNPYLMITLITMADKIAGRTESLDSLFKTFPAAVKATRQGRLVAGKLDDEMKTALGHKAFDFSQADTAGQSVSLSSFKGQYVLIDFWASDDPALGSLLGWTVNAFKTYKNKGFTIVGVSLDGDKNAWLTTIRNTPMNTWTQVCDLRGMNNSVARLYGITSPHKNVLIDPNGIIIAKNISATELGNTLSAILD